MSLLMVLIGAPIGAVIGMLLMQRLTDVAKERQQLESKTTYDYALTNAINERDRLQDELRTIHALKRTEADAERIRNEIGTILSDDGEGSSEGAYERNIGMPIRDNGDGTFSPLTWDNRISSGDMVDSASKAFSTYGTNVREDVSKDERLAEEDVERSLTKAVRDSFENNEGIRVFWEDSHGRARSHYGSANEIQTGNGKVKYFSVRGLEFSARDVLRITKGRDVDDETLYRKGVDVEDEPLAYMSAERMYTNLLNTTGSKPRIVSVFWVNESEDGRYWHHTSGELNGSAWTNEGLSYVTVDNECIDGDKVDLITKGRRINGETLYRKGNR